MAVWIISLILIVSIVLFITERFPVDFISIGIMVALMTTGILSPQEALNGFSNPAVITIGAMFILSKGLMQTGALGFVSERMIEYSKGHEKRILLLAMLGAFIPSAFLNNTPVVVLFVTIIMSVCCEYGLSPSKYLIPISYSSILGGTCTLIGTSTNLIVSDLSIKYGYGPIGMFELSPVGVPIALLIMTGLYFTAPRMMPQHKAPVCELTDKQAPRYLAELLVPAESGIIGQDPLSFFTQKHPSIEVYELIRGPYIHFPERERVRMVENDLLFVKGSASDLVALLRERLFELPHKVEELDLKGRDEESLIVELIVTPESRWLGEQPIQSDLQKELGIQIVAVKRHGIHYSDQKIRNLRLAIGDVLLIHCSRERLDQIRSRADFIILEDVHHRIINKKKAPLAILIFVAMIATATVGVTSITVSAVTGVFFMILTGCLRLRDAYRSVDVKVLIMIVGTIALGAAMEKTGAARTYAEAFLSPFVGQSPYFILGMFILFTSIVTELMSNSATAVLLFPIGISTALFLQVDPRPFIVGICFGASCGFAIPIGYQTNLLVYGPGGYRFKDFLKMGIPAHLLTWLMASFLIPLFWPF